MPRAKLLENESGGSYFSSPKTNIEFISSGCMLLDCVLGGGYPLGRIVNIVGDKSTGKTLLAIEACANFAASYPDGMIWYREAEAAFDLEYAGALGLPLDRVVFNGENDFLTIEDIFEDLENCLETYKDTKGLYIIDSLDALSDRSEMSRKIDEGTYGAAKAKKLSELFRRLTRKLSNSNICVLIISQVRDNIGVTFGERFSRSGGRALDFYASQSLWLSQTGTKKRTIKGVERVCGVDIRARCKKNKISMPFRECDFPILFGFGLDDLTANILWLEKTKLLKDDEDSKKLLRSIPSMSDEEYKDVRTKYAERVKQHWYEIEEQFIPTRKKY